MSQLNEACRDDFCVQHPGSNSICAFESDGGAFELGKLATVQSAVCLALEDAQGFIRTYIVIPTSMP